MWEILEIKDVLKTYARQNINLHKSSIAFSKGLNDYLYRRLSEVLGVKMVNAHENILAFQHKWADHYMVLSVSLSTVWLKDYRAGTRKNFPRRVGRL